MGELDGLSPYVIAALKSPASEVGAKDSATLVPFSRHAPRSVAKDRRHDDYALYVRDRRARLDEYEYRVQDYLKVWAQRNSPHGLVPEEVESGIRELVREAFLEEVNQWAHDHPEELRSH